MPPKDDDDPKSTKEVVTKKQKQMLNREELDLSLIAEAFGGVVITESTDLVEFFKIRKFLRRLAKSDADADMRDVPFESDPNIRRIKGQKILDRLLGSPPTNTAFNIVNIAKRSPRLAAALYAFEPTPVADATLDAARKRGDLFVPPKPKPGFVPSKPKPSIIPVKPGPPKRGPKTKPEPEPKRDPKPEPKPEPKAPTIKPPSKTQTRIGLPDIFKFPSGQNLGQSTIAIPQPQPQSAQTPTRTRTTTKDKPKRDRKPFRFNPPEGGTLYLGRRQNPQ